MAHLSISNDVVMKLSELRSLLKDVHLDQHFLSEVFAGATGMENTYSGGCGGCGANCACTCAYACEASCSASCKGRLNSWCYNDPFAPQQ
jgi:hypothetical protein